MAKKSDTLPVEPVAPAALAEPSEPVKTEDVKPRLVLVKSGRLDGRIACWDRHPDQPNGEICVDGEGVPVLVAETPKVLGCLADGSLIRA